jgi:P2-related tail formation protein
MQKIKNSDLYDLMPPSYQTVEMKCIAYALSRAMTLLCEAADKVMLTANMEALDEKALDYLALELRTQYYDQELSREQKIELIKGSLQWYMYAGTKKSLKDMIRALFFNSVVKEWHEYGGDPYHFKVNVVAEGYSKDDIDRLFEIIDIAKNARSILDGINLEFGESVIQNINKFVQLSQRTDDTISTAGQRTERVLGSPKAFVQSSQSPNNVIKAQMVIYDSGSFTDEHEDIIDGGGFTSPVSDNVLDFNY